MRAGDRCRRILRLFLLAAPLAAVALGATAQRPALRVYSTEDGLKFSQIFCVFQDSRGFLWAGTAYGAGRYDGRNFANLTAVEGLPHDSVKGFAEDDEGRLWVLTQEGPAVVGATAGPSGAPVVEPLPESAGALSGRRFQTATDRDGAVWFVGQGDVYRWCLGRLEKIARVRVCEPYAVCPDGAGGILVSNGRDVVRVGRGGSARLAVPAGTGKIVGLVSMDGERLLVTPRAVARLEGERFVPDGSWAFPSGFSADGASAGSGRLILCSDSDGVAVLQRGRAPELIDSAHGLPARGAPGAFVDRDGVLWLATDNGLVKVYDLDLHSWHSRVPGLGGMVLVFARDARGVLWVGHSEGLSRLGGDGRLEPVCAGEIREVWSLLPLDDGTVLVGTRRGLAALKDGHVRRFPELVVMGRSRVYGLMRDRQGRYWATTLTGVVRFRWDKGRGRPSDVEVIAGDVEGRGICQAGDGTVWIGTDGQGLLAWKDGKLRTYGLAEGLPILVSRIVLPRPEGVWVGTEKGLWLLSNGRAREVKWVNESLRDRYIVSLSADGDSVWVAATYDLLRLTNGRVTARLDHSRGLAGASCTAEHCLFVEKGRLWLGMTGGFSEVDTTSATRDLPPPEVSVLCAKDRDGRQVRSGGRMRFPARSLTVSFFSPTYLAEDKTLFSYRLLGQDDRWSSPRRSTEASFTNLPPGRYVFEVRALGAGGRASVAPARLPFTVAMPWGLAASALGVLLLLLAASAWAVSGLRTRAVRRRNQALEGQVRQRTAQLAEANRRLQALAASDGLTGIANHRLFERHLAGEWARAKRDGSEISLLMIDVDHFKAYNDALGHPQGDECLKAVASAAAKSASRPGDLAARYGGEEFAVILPGTGAEGARSVAEQIRASLASLALTHPSSPVGACVTVSVGAATRVPAEGDEPSDLVAAADEALYRAKGEGRDRCVVAGGAGEPPFKARARR